MLTACLPACLAAKVNQSEPNAPQLSVKKCFQRSFVMQKGASAAAAAATARGDDVSAAAYRRSCSSA